ncbi:MAG: 50S ribosomal protein L11 methyltransferase, partial [Clostridia bacterium]|nr:50S ribosomal protein L11 methyltransferase [Clostridia bacterium]
DEIPQAGPGGSPENKEENMDWLEAVVHTTTMGADIVSEVLMNAGAVGTSIEDRYDVTSSKKEDGMWDMIDEEVLAKMSEDVLVKAYFKNDASVQEIMLLVGEKLAELKRFDMGFDIGSLALENQSVQEQDWAENWKKYYKPFRAGSRLVIKPSWEAYEEKEGDLVLELDPGMAFGTGTHETTFMCMEQLEKYVTPGCKTIDVGCGSGILGLAAAKLGSEDVLAIDLDELAVKVAAENTVKNGLADKVRVVHGDLLEKADEMADVIVANIIADVICFLCGPAKKHLLPGGTFICSGIIREREDDVQAALAAAGYTVCNRLAKGSWVCLAAKAAQ